MNPYSPPNPPENHDHQPANQSEFDSHPIEYRILAGYALFVILFVGIVAWLG